MDNQLLSVRPGTTILSTKYIDSPVIHYLPGTPKDRVVHEVYRYMYMHSISRTGKGVMVTGNTISKMTSLSRDIFGITQWEDNTDGSI